MEQENQNSANPPAGGPGQDVATNPTPALTDVTDPGSEQTQSEKDKAPLAGTVPASRSKKKIVLIVIAVLLLLAVGSAAAYFMIFKDQITQPSPTPTPTPETIDETANWKTYTNSKYGFSVKYPPSLNLAEEVDIGSIGDQIVFSISKTSPLDCKGDCKVIEKQEEVIIAGLNATKLEGYQGEVGGCGPQKYISYVFKKNQNFITFSLYATTCEALRSYKGDIVELKAEDVELFDQILSTFKFLEEKSESPYFSIPQSDSKVTSPLTVKGVVPSDWMFEGQLPIKLLDSKREVIVATNALETTPGSWTSGEPVEFSTTLSWMASSLGGSTSGYLVISKDNPSGLPENEKSYEIPVKF